MQKLVINQAIEARGLAGVQRLAAFIDGVSRHSPEGVAFAERAAKAGWKQTVQKRGLGLRDWTGGTPFDDSG